MAGAQMKVLIVNDDLSLFERLQGYCAGNAPDISVLSAISGPRALAIAAYQKPDVIVIDAAIPDIDGYELAAKFRLEQGADGGRVVMLAAVLDEVAATRAKDAGAVAQISVDASLPEMVTAVRRA
ncbi:MAG TPA: response regulator, partial [Coriobacteriia bacterium]